MALRGCTGRRFSRIPNRRVPFWVLCLSREDGYEPLVMDGIAIWSLDVRRWGGALQMYRTRLPHVPGPPWCLDTLVALAAPVLEYGDVYRFVAGTFVRGRHIRSWLELRRYVPFVGCIGSGFGVLLAATGTESACSGYITYHHRDLLMLLVSCSRDTVAVSRKFAKDRHWISCFADVGTFSSVARLAVGMDISWAFVRKVQLVFLEVHRRPSLWCLELVSELLNCLSVWKFSSVTDLAMVQVLQCSLYMPCCCHRLGNLITGYHPGVFVQ